MSSYEKLKKEIDDGLLGKNEGISLGFDSLGTLLPSTNYLVGAESGVGKTSLVDTCFCLNVIEAIEAGVTDKTVRIFYDSLEISTGRKLAKWACAKLFKDYGIIMDSKTLLGMKENKISTDIYDKVRKTRDYFNIIDKYVVFNDKKIHPTGTFMKVKEYCESVGKITKTSAVHNGKTYVSHKYTPNNPNEIVLSITDHIRLLKSEMFEGRVTTTKQKLDLHSDHAIELRNMYGVSNVHISQFNRELSDYGRQKFKELAPQAGDFKDSGNMYEDCDVCWSPFSPKMHGIKQYGGYDIIKLQNRIIFNWILKNRDGEADVRVPVNFLGEAGYFRQMPTMDALSRNPNLMNKVTKFLK